jgi:hypothetical protein
MADVDDAVQLASALLLADPDLILVSWNKRLRLAAAQAGLDVAPAIAP